MLILINQTIDKRLPDKAGEINSRLKSVPLKPESTTQFMTKPRITFGTKEQSKEESFLKDIERSPSERVNLFLEMSEFYLKLYPPPKPEPDHNFHIYRDEH